MKLSFIKNCTIGLALSLASVAANADIVNVTEGEVGAFKDTESGLTWIDFGHTNFMRGKLNYDEALHEISTGEKFKDWVLATDSQISELVTNIETLGIHKHEGKASVLAEIMGTNAGKTARATYMSGDQAKRFDFLVRGSTDIFRAGIKTDKLMVNGSYSIMLVKATK